MCGGRSRVSRAGLCAHASITGRVSVSERSERGGEGKAGVERDSVHVRRLAQYKLGCNQLNRPICIRLPRGTSPCQPALTSLPRSSRLSLVAGEPQRQLQDEPLVTRRHPRPCDARPAAPPVRLDSVGPAAADSDAKAGQQDRTRTRRATLYHRERHPAMARRAPDRTPPAADGRHCDSPTRWRGRGAGQGDSEELQVRFAGLCTASDALCEAG